MADILLQLLAVYALTFAIMNGKAAIVTDHLQRWSFFRSMFQCSLCTGTEVGFWSHFVCHAWVWIGNNPLHSGYNPLDSVVFGLAAGAFCLVVDTFLGALDTTE